MLSFFRNTKIGVRILLAVLIPTVVLAVVEFLKVSEELETAQKMEQVVDMTALTVEISGVAHELQRERGVSAVYLGSGGTQLVDEMPVQQARTDEARHRYEQAVRRAGETDAAADFAALLGEASGAVGELDGKRGEISGQRIKAAASNQYFDETIGKLLRAARMIVRSMDHQALATAGLSYVNFMNAKERAGQERATAAPAFASGTFEVAAYRRFMAVLAEQETYFSLYNFYAPEVVKEFFVRTVVGESIGEVERMRALAIEAGAGGALSGADGSYWYKMTTARIDLLKQVEDRMAQELSGRAEAVADEAWSALVVNLAVSIGLIAVTIVLGFLVIRSITRPLAGMTRAMDALAGGDRTTEIVGLGRRDEIGAMAKAVQVFKENMIRNAELEAEQATKREAEAARQRKIEAMISEFDAKSAEAIEAMAAAAGELQTSSQSLSTSAEQTTHQSAAVAAASEQASANVQTVASAAEELSASVHEIGRQAAQSAAITQKAVEEASRSNRMVSGLAEAAQKIGDVISLINDIAGQTNLLALNATIEAARAGEAGKGFAVVASEVKSLATQTAKATEDISGQIGAIQDATAQSVETIKAIGETIAEVNSIVSAIAAAVEEQGAVTKEIAGNVQQAASGTQEVSSNIAGVNQAAEETGNVAGRILDAATALSHRSDQLSRDVTSFLAAVKAA
ncbi:MAG: methyl-accepting chemotaxis protein [Alphaproteobacteria bacterium]